jgi:hypothetical protein
MLKEIQVKFNEFENDASGNTVTVIKNYKVKRNNRALRHWELINRKSLDELQSGTMTGQQDILYCCLVVNNPDFKYTHDEFIDLLDENPGVFQDFQLYLIDLSLEVFDEIEEDKKKL